jgi:hypothetical protein
VSDPAGGTPGPVTDPGQESAFVEASLARVARLDEGLRGLGLGTAPLPLMLAWGPEDDG